MKNNDRLRFLFLKWRLLSQAGANEDVDWHATAAAAAVDEEEFAFLGLNREK